MSLKLSFRNSKEIQNKPKTQYSGKVQGFDEGHFSLPDD